MKWVNKGDYLLLSCSLNNVQTRLVSFAYIFQVYNELGGNILKPPSLETRLLYYMGGLYAGELHGSKKSDRSKRGGYHLF